MPVKEQLNPDSKPPRRPLSAYIVTLAPFLIAMGSCAILLEYSVLPYLLLCSAMLSGFVIAGMLGSNMILSGPRNKWHKVLSYFPGWQQLSENLDTLQESTELLEARYQTLTDNLAAAILFRDVDGNILYCSPYIEVLTGYSQQEIYDDSEGFFARIVHDEDTDKVARSLKVSQLGEAFQFRYRFYHKTGLLMWAETRSVPLLDENEQLQALLSITFDVTGSMRYQQRVEEHNNDLKDFSYMLSHDLKSPMVTIRGMLTALREDYGEKLDSDALGLIDHAERASDRLQNLVAGVIEYSRVSNLEEKQQPIDCSTLVSEVTQELQVPLSEANGSFEVESLPVVWGDKTMLYQVFLNLISNAIKYRDPQRRIHISVRSSMHQDERTCEIVVADNGRGIPEDRIENIFRPFHRAHGSEIEGSGIGLASVKKLIERIGGSISVESNEGSGSVFTVRLRVADPNAAPLPIQ